jgi:O-antigen/teichoic acid export membrane protein
MQKIRSLKNNLGFMKYFKNTSWLFGEKILRMVVGLFVGIWVARYLGPEQFGVFSYAQSFVGLFAAIATLGLDGIVVRELVKDESRRDELVGTAFWLKLLGALGVLIVLAIAVNFTSNDSYTNSLVFIIASATVFQSFNVVDMYFQSKVLSKYIAYANVISLFISSIVKIILILNETPLIAFAWVILFDSFILACGYVYFYIKKNSKFNIRSVGSTLGVPNLIFKRETAVSLLKDSWPLIFGSISASIYMQIDQVMIKDMMDSTSVGYYAVAVKLSSVWLFITVAITSSLAPSIINAKKNNHELYIRRIQLMYNVLVKISVVISIFTYVFSEYIVLKLYGKDYSQSIDILNIYIWSIVFVFLSNGSWSYYLNENLQKLASLRLIYGAVINVIINMYFIEYYGLVGAAYATIISYSISSYFINFFYKRTRMIFLLQTKALLNLFRIYTWINPLNKKTEYPPVSG